MRSIAYKYLLLFIIFTSYCSKLYPISIVYNFRIAQITKQPIYEHQDVNNHIIALVFDQLQKKYTGGIRQNFLGALGSYIYSFRPYYFRTDLAVSHIKEKTKSVTTFSGTEMDDILFTFGSNVRENKVTPITISVLFGVPTHRIFRLQHVDFGISQVGLGIQLDGFYQFDDKHAFIYGGRYVYFIPRKALDSSHKRYKFTIGNTIDLLAAYKINWDHHGFELGFTERFNLGAHICPHLDNTVEKTNYIRTNFYAVYKYKFLIRNVHNRLLFNISYSFDTSSKIFGNRYVIFLWSSWSVGF